MKTYYIQIGTMNGQNNYNVKAENAKQAKIKAIERHKELGRSMEGKNVYIILAH